MRPGSRANYSRAVSILSGFWSRTLIPAEGLEQEQKLAFEMSFGDFTAREKRFNLKLGVMTRTLHLSASLRGQTIVDGR